MSQYKNQEIDFVSRTRKIIQQYDNLEIPKAEKFEVTLLINCFVGLLILPQQFWFNKLPSSEISTKEWGINPQHISFVKKGEFKSVKNIVKHLRNSVAHYRFTAFDNSNKEITSIKFEDIAPKTKEKTFEAVIPISGIRKFTTKLTDVFVKSMANS